MPRSRLLIAALALCLLLSGCGKKPKLNKTNFDKIYDAMTLQDVEAVLGRGRELSAESKAPPGGSFGGAAGGIAIPADAPKGPELLPRISLSGGKVMEWTEDNRVVQMVFVNDKMKVKEKKGF